MPRPNRGPRLVLKAPRGYTAPASFIRWYEGGRKKEKAIVIGVCVLNRAGKPCRAVTSPAPNGKSVSGHKRHSDSRPPKVRFAAVSRPSVYEYRPLRGL